MYNIFKYIKYSKLNKNKINNNTKSYINSYRKLWIDNIKDYCP